LCARSVDVELASLQAGGRCAPDVLQGIVQRPARQLRGAADQRCTPGLDA
jgi:hypothetical protein